MAKLSLVCPECKAKLAVQDSPGIREKIIACPKCHFKAQVSVYMGGVASRGGQGADEQATQLPSFSKTPRISNPGKIVVTSNHATYYLKRGHNVIGRQAATSTADIQIPGDQYMSRRHVDIEVVAGANGLEHRLIEINSANIIKLNDEPIDRGDILKLNDGDILTLGVTEVLFTVGEEMGDESDKTKLV